MGQIADRGKILRQDRFFREDLFRVEWVLPILGSLQAGPFDNLAPQWILLLYNNEGRQVVLASFYIDVSQVGLDPAAQLHGLGHTVDGNHIGSIAHVNFLLERHIQNTMEGWVILRSSFSRTSSLVQ